MINVAIVEDDIFFRTELQNYLNESKEFNCSFAVDTGHKFLRYIGNAEELDIVIIDIGLPDMSGLDIINILYKRDIKAEIAILTLFNDSDTIFQALCKGANHYILKGDDVSLLRSKLKRIHNKDVVFSSSVARKIISYFHPKKNSLLSKDNDLTPKEFQILQFITDGLSYKLIASTMGMSINGVRYYIKRIYKKLQVNSKAEAIKKFNTKF